MTLLKRRRGYKGVEEMEPLPSSLVQTPARALKRARIGKDTAPPDGWTAREIQKWSCKICGFIQRNQRQCDLKRHERTHTKTEAFICCGIREGASGKWIRPVPGDQRKEPVYIRGAWRVGGCQKTFTRLDALRRHLHSKPGLECTTDYYEFLSKNK